MTDLAHDQSLTICVQFPIERPAVQDPDTVQRIYDDTMRRLGQLAGLLRVHLGPWARVEDIGTDNVNIRAEVYVVCRSIEYLGACRDICRRVLQDLGYPDPAQMVQVFGPVPEVKVLPVTAQDRDALRIVEFKMLLAAIETVLLNVSCQHRGHPERWIKAAEAIFRTMKISRKAALEGRITAFKIPHANADGDISVYQIVRANPEYFPTFHDPEKRGRSV